MKQGHTLFFRLLGLLFIAVIFGLSAQQAPASAALSRSVTQELLSCFSSYRALPAAAQLQVIGQVHELLRSAAHFGLFFCMGGCLALGFGPDRRSKKTIAPFLLAFFFCFFYAVFDELHQQFFSLGRAFEWADLAKDWLGSSLGILLVAVGKRAHRRSGSGREGM